MISLFLLFIFWVLVIGSQEDVFGTRLGWLGVLSCAKIYWILWIYDGMEILFCSGNFLFISEETDGGDSYRSLLSFSVLLFSVNGHFVVYFLYFLIHLFCFCSSKGSASIQHLYSLSSPSNPLSSDARQCLVRRLNRIGMFEAKSRRRCQANRLPNPPFPRKLRTCQSGRVSFYGGTGNAGSEPSFTLGS